jgi:cystathionine gamma-lyase/cystathionine gamma-lyase/homocysteine desulfhydrase
MDAISQALHHRIAIADAAPAVTPLFQNSAFFDGSPYFYTRKANPNIAELEQVVALLEGAAHATAFATGMAALDAVLSLLSPGDVLVINRLIYGCSYKAFQRVAARRALELHVLDLSTPEGIAAIPPDVAMLIFETPTNPYLETIDIAAVAARAKAGNPAARVVVDNTWATPLFQQPLRHGADLSVHSATKYLGGHSDVMGGFVLADDPALAAEMAAHRFYAGAVLDPHAAWLMRRSLQTLGVRIERHAQTTRTLAAFLAGLEGVERVYHPRVDGAQLTGYAGIVFVLPDAALGDCYARLAHRLRLFGTGTGMACVTSMIARPYSGSHASLDDAEKAAMGLSPRLIRLCFGLEHPDDLIRDLADAFAAERAALSHPLPERIPA